MSKKYWSVTLSCVLASALSGYLTAMLLMLGVLGLATFAI